MQKIENYDVIFTSTRVFNTIKKYYRYTLQLNLTFLVLEYVQKIYKTLVSAPAPIAHVNI